MSGAARPFKIVQKAYQKRRIQIFKKVDGVVSELDVTDYTGKYVAKKLLEDPPAKALLKIPMVIEDAEEGIISFEFKNEAGPAGTDQAAFKGFEEITLFDALSRRIPVSLPGWAGKEYGAFELIATAVE